jgi:Acetoacetate decarboxylase (ADC)
MASLQDDGSWEIRGHRIRFPVRIAAAAAACAAYVVRTSRVAGLLAGTGLEPVSVAGRTPLFLLLVDYRVSDLGVYDEVGVALLVRHRGRVGGYVHQLPVTETFTMEAGRALWGLPKWLADAVLEIDGPDATCHLDTEAGGHVLTAAIRTLRWRLPLRVPAAFTVFAPRDGAVLAIPVRGRASGIRIGIGGGTVVLGSGHPMADDLRAAGLPRRPLATATIENLAFELDPAQVATR